MSSPSPRRRSSAPAVESPLDDDDLLQEILLRLPPQPSSLPRVSAVSKRWRRLASDHRFTRRFRRRHRRNSPLLGFIEFDPEYGLSFVPTLDAPNRVPWNRFSMLKMPSELLGWVLGCRHGLVLAFHESLAQVMVLDPANDDLHCLDLPPGFGMMTGMRIHGAVLRADDDGDGHFHIVLVGNDDQHHARQVACTYSSKKAAWSNFVSTMLPPGFSDPQDPLRIDRSSPAILIGDSLYWNYNRPRAILEFDLGTQNLAVIPLPRDVATRGLSPDLLTCASFTAVRAEGGGLGFLFLSPLDSITAELWKRETDRRGVASSSWVLTRTVELKKLLSLDQLDPEALGALCIQTYAEHNNIVFLHIEPHLFMLHLGTMKLKQFKTYSLYTCPFESVYTAGIGGETDGAELLHHSEDE